MGAESSMLQDCEWGPNVACPPKFPWEMSPVKKPDGTSVTVFEPKNSDSKDEDLLRKSASTLRGLRHPNIIRFIGCAESSDGFWLATEAVLPLFSFVSDMSSQELCAGLHDLLHGLDFLHSKLGICHNNICLLSVYVSSDGSWKLGGLEHACRFTEATQEFLDRCRALRHEDSLSPEEKTNRVKVDSSLGHARDVFAFGSLVDVVLDLVKEKDSCAQMLEQQLSLCLHADPATRPSVSSLLNLSVFKSDLIEILTFLRNITAKIGPEKQDFFCKLMPRLCQLSEMALARRLVVPLLARFVLLDQWAVAHVLPHLLTPKGSSFRKFPPFVQGLLPEHLFRQYVINHIYNMFHVYDCHVRLVLLEHFSHYVNMFTRQQLEDDVFLQVLLGVRDTDDRLVAASLRALADLVPVLGGDVVVGGVRKPFFFHGMPKMTTQTLSKMNAPHNMMDILADHKPLLKNLALSSQSALGRASADRDGKVRDREQRRQEAKMKREGRRNQLKEKQIDNKHENCEHKDNAGQTLDLILDDEVTFKSTTGEKEYNDGDNYDNVNSADTESNHLGTETEGLDWSDWEDAHKQISDEIELELQAIDGLEHKILTSPSPYKSHSQPALPPVKVDWSVPPEADPDVNSSNRMPGVRFGYPSRSGVRDLVSIHTGSHDGFLDNSEGITKDRLELVHKDPNSPPSSAGSENLKLNTATTKHQSKKAGENDLGAGLDIKSINIMKRATPPELDFFADMAPVLSESKKTSLLGDDAMSVSDSSLGTKIEDGLSRVKTSDLFAVVPTSEEEVKGWSEDDDTGWEIAVPGT